MNRVQQCCTLISRGGDTPRFTVFILAIDFLTITVGMHIHDDTLMNLEHLPTEFAKSISRCPMQLIDCLRIYILGHSHQT